MSKFIQIDDCGAISHHTGRQAWRRDLLPKSFLRMSSILEVCGVGFYDRLTVPVTKEEYEENKDNEDYHLNGGDPYKYIDTTVIYVDGYLDERKHLRINEDIDSFMDRLNVAETEAETLLDKARAEAEKPHRLLDRGEWVSGESYAPLDYVTKPGTANTYLCLAENKSSSAGVLANASFWCPITLPEANE